MVTFMDTTAFYMPALFQRQRNALPPYYTMISAETAPFPSGIRLSNRSPAVSERPTYLRAAISVRQAFRPDACQPQKADVQDTRFLRASLFSTIFKNTKAPPLLMIPTKRPAGRFVGLSNAPQILGTMLWGDGKSSETIQKRAVAWMKAFARPVRDATVALEAIAWAEEMPRIEKILESEDCLALGELLSSLPADVDQQTLKDQPLLHQLLAGELAWTLAERLPQAPYGRRLERSGRAAISLGFNQILDRQGMLPARHFRILRPLLACWTRCRALAAASSRGGLGPRVEQRYQRFVRNALRCTRPDGRPMLAEDDGDSWGPEPFDSLIKTGWKPILRGDLWGRELFEAVLNGGVEETNRGLAAASLPNLSPGTVAKASTKAADLPPPSIYWEEGAIAVMRRNWNRGDERIAVLFAGRTCQVELVASGRVAASGAWRFEISQQGRQLQPESDWESNCWYTDEEVDFLELEIKLTTGVTLQRQIVFARADRFLLLADAVMSRAPCTHGRPGNLEYRSVLPLAPQVEFRGAEESREGHLLYGRGSTADGKSAASANSVAFQAACPRSVAFQAANQPLAQVLPLALPEWRAEQHGGELKMIPEGLELRQTSAGQRLYAPLFIDLDRRRFRRRMTWRPLTVAESLAAVPSEVAVGFRVAIGDRQWIVYRSLATRGNRTLLGHNLATESLIARFGKDGEVKSIVEIE